MADASPPERVLGVLAGDDMPSAQLARWVASADYVFAADGAANRLLELGIVPNMTIGDLDSISEEAARAQTRLVKQDDQNTTDCDKLLGLASGNDLEALTLIGVEGDLLDHMLGTIQSVARFEMNVRLALRRGIGIFLNGPAERILSAQVGGRVSVIPLDRCEGVTLTGTRWELKRAKLDPFGRTSLSNVAENEKIRLRVRSGHVFVFLETDGEPRWGEP